MKHLQLMDMLVVGEYPAKMIKALAVIAARLHPAYDALPNPAKLGSSKESCLFASLAVRDFLVAIGYKDATVRTCALYARAMRDGEEVWSLGIGVPGETELPGKFNGHAAVIVPSAGILIDTTLYQAIRPQWQGALTGMMAVQLQVDSPHKVLRALPQIAGIEMRAEGDPMLFEIAWGDRPDINWKQQLDYRDPVSLQRRRGVAKALAEAFGEFREAK